MKEGLHGTRFGNSPPHCPLWKAPWSPGVPVHHFGAVSSQPLAGKSERCPNAVASPAQSGCPLTEMPSRCQVRRLQEKCFLTMVLREGQVSSIPCAPPLLVQEVP